MALPQVIINNISGGLGRPLASEDMISGLVFYSTALPSGYTNSNRIKEVFSIKEAEALGILNTHIGEIRSVGGITINVTGATSDTLTLKVNTADETLTLGTYTQATTDSTPTLVATALATAINANSGSTGMIATASTATVSFQAPVGAGVGANSWTYAIEMSGTLSGTSTAWSGGVGSQIDVLHYHIDEFFRLQPKGDLYVGVYSATTDYSEVVTLQNYALGKIRQLGVYTQTNFASSIVQNLQSAANTLSTGEKPLEIFLQANFSTISDLTSLIDLHILNSKNVSVCFGQDADATGYELWKALNKSIGVVGCYLGAHAFAKVSENVAWAQKFRLDEVELEKLAFANGSKLNLLSDGLITAIDNKGYVFARYMVSYPGSYFNLPYTATLVTSDYSRVPTNRALHKAERNLRKYLAPLLASPVIVNSDGALSESTVKIFKTEAEQSLIAMQAASEISDFKVDINPLQNVASTGILTINVSIVPVGSADFIQVNLGLVLSIS